MGEKIGCVKELITEEVLVKVTELILRIKLLSYAGGLIFLVYFFWIIGKLGIICDIGVCEVLGILCDVVRILVWTVGGDELIVEEGIFCEMDWELLDLMKWL